MAGQCGWAPVRCTVTFRFVPQIRQLGMSRQWDASCRPALRQCSDAQCHGRPATAAPRSRCSVHRPSRGCFAAPAPTTTLPLPQTPALPGPPRRNAPPGTSTPGVQARSSAAALSWSVRGRLGLPVARFFGWHEPASDRCCCRPVLYGLQHSLGTKRQVINAPASSLHWLTWMDRTHSLLYLPV